MTNDSSGKGPIAGIREVWSSSLDATAALDAIVQSFSGSSAKVERTEGAVQVRTGSNWRYRLFGNALLGSKTLPVALDVIATSVVGGSAIEAHAYDTFKWRITEQSFFGAEESFDQRLKELLTSAAKAAEAAKGTTAIWLGNQGNSGRR